MENLFAHDTIRSCQKEFIEKFSECLEKRSNMLVHAPTGTGKTAASLGPAVRYAIDNNKTVFFLTSRQTQHMIAVDTLRSMQKRSSEKFVVCDLLGKQSMCLMPQVRSGQAMDFFEFCKKAKEDNACSFYTNYKKGNKRTVRADNMLGQLKNQKAQHAEEVMNTCDTETLCPYEITMDLITDAQVVICDYFHLFSPTIRETFFSRSEKYLSESIIIVDEAHNLPARCIDLMSTRITTRSIQRAYKEAEQFELSECLDVINSFSSAFEKLQSGFFDQEKKISKEDFIHVLCTSQNIDSMITLLANGAEIVREKKEQSSLGALASFLGEWGGDDEGFVRIFAKEPGDNREVFSLSYKCLDPGLVSKPVIEGAHSMLMMSGTLYPVDMYHDLLGFSPDDTSLVLPNPFPIENRMSLIVPRTTTKYTARSETMYEEIGTHLVTMLNAVPGNCAVFFPSYYLLNAVKQYVSFSITKTVLSEEQGMSKDERKNLIENFKQYKDSGAVLLGTSSGSFGEGIDLPGDFLKCVIVVGLPLGKPDLETKELIAYYDKLYGKGWDYGYVFPALNKTLQNAGRCIRSSTDKGVIMFLDERYAWDQYYRCFPKDMDVRITELYKERIEKFFN